MACYRVNFTFTFTFNPRTLLRNGIDLKTLKDKELKLCKRGWLNTAVHFDILGLFHRAVSQSGTALCPWALAEKESNKRQTEKLASLLHCPSQPSSALVSCLRRRNSMQITATDTAYQVSTRLGLEA